METLIDYLNEWLYQHILKSDRELAALLNRKQAARPPLIRLAGCGRTSPAAVAG